MNLVMFDPSQNIGALPYLAKLRRVIRAERTLTLTLKSMEIH